MENAIPWCRFCGARPKKNAQRCKSCGSSLSTSVTPENIADVPSSGDTALADKLQPWNRKMRICNAFGLLFSIPSLMVFFAFFEFGVGSGFSAGIGVLGTALGSMFLVVGEGYRKRKKALISTHVIQAMLEDNFELITYSPQNAMPRAEGHAAQPPSWKAQRLRNDFFRAKYRGVSFEFADGFPPLPTPRGRDRGSPKGQWLILEMHKAISAPLMISDFEQEGGFPKEAWQGRLNGTSAVLTEAPDNLPKVLTPEFEAFLVSPDHLFLKNSGKHIFFAGTHVHYAVDTRRDFFEPCKKLQDIPVLRERVQREIDCIKSIIDGFLLLEAFFHGTETAHQPKRALTQEESASP